MHKKLLIGFFVLLLLLGGGILVLVGVKPRPIPKIKLSFFENPTKLAQAINLRLHEEIRSSPILAFGYQPEKLEQIEVLRQFLASLQESGFRYENLVLEEKLPNLGVGFENAEKINMRDNLQLVAEVLKKAMEQGKRVLLVMPSVYSAQVVAGNISDQLVKKYQLPLTSISIVELLTNREQEKYLSIPCLVSDTEQTGTGALGCAILQASRSIYRKKMELDKRPGLMDQMGARDYLVFY